MVVSLKTLLIASAALFLLWVAVHVQAANTAEVQGIDRDHLPVWKQSAPTQRELDEANNVYTRARAGNAEAQVSIGLGYLRGPVATRKYSEALRWFRKAADQGYPLAQYYVGAMYLQGYGAEKSAAQALKWFRMAAEHGETDAMVRLGTMYELGEGAAVDLNEAVHWYQRAAGLGNSEAQNRMGVLYLSRKIRAEEQSAVPPGIEP